MKNKTKILSLVLATTLFLGLLTTSTSAPLIIEPIKILPLLFHQPDAALSRSMGSDGVMYPSGTHTAGDKQTNAQVKCFLSFDISGIPAGATITSATLGLTSSSVAIGNPFATLGNLRVYYVDYGTSLTVSDFNGPKLATVWSGSSAPSDVIDVAAELANAVSSGKKNLQFRIEYATLTDNDNSADRIEFNNPTLLYFYSTPASKPDFKVTNIEKGTSNMVVVTIANSGAGDYSGEIGMKIWFNGVTKFDGSGTVNMPAGTTATVNFPTLILPEGSTTVKVAIDSSGAVSEESETNNERTQTLTVAASPTPSNNPPQANAGANKAGNVGQSVSFNGTGSTDSDGSIISYAWDFGDGSSSSGSVVTHVYTSPGTYTVSLTVTDNNGATDTDTTVAIITGESTTPPPSTNKLPNADAGSDLKVKVGESVHFDASKSTDSDGTITNYDWDFGDSRDSDEKEPLHSYATPGVYKVTLTVTDNNGGTDQDVIYVTVEEASSSPIKGVPGFEVPGVLGAAALLYYYVRRRKK